MKPMFRRNAVRLAASLLLVCGSAGAGEAEDARRLQQSTTTLIDLLVQGGVMTREKGDSMVGELRGPAPSAPGVPPNSADQLRRLRNANADLVKLLVEKGVLRRDVGHALIDQAQPGRFGADAPSAAAVAVPGSPTPAPEVVPVPMPEIQAALPPLPPPPVRVVPVAPEGADVAAGAKAPDDATHSAPAVATSPEAPTAPDSAVVVASPDVRPAAPTPLAPSVTENPKAGQAAVPSAAAPTVSAEAAPVPPGVIRVPYVPQIVRDQIKEEIRNEVLAQAKDERWGEPGALPDWLRRLTPFGDVRVREELNRFPDSDRPNAPPVAFAAPPYGASIANTTDTRSRLRLRTRLGLKAAISEEVRVGLRLASGAVGSGTTPVSENVSLGNYNARTSIGIDRAYISYRPWEPLNITAGRFDNPFFTPTDLVWSTSDTLSLEGLAVSYVPAFAGAFDVAATTGAFPIQQKDNQLIPTPDSNAKDKWLYGVQTTMGWRIVPVVKATLGLAYYHYENVEGCLNPAINSTDCDSTTAPFRQFGNQVFDIRRLTNEANNSQAYLFGLLSRFRELNASASLNISQFSPTHVLLDADWVRNLGFDADEIRRRTGVQDAGLLSKDVDGYQLRVTVGTPSVARLAQWQLYTGYRRLERDATLDAFTDSDFHLGGTNAKGYFFGGRLGVAKQTSVSLKWMSADSIDGPPLAIDVMQLDLTARF